MSSDEDRELLRIERRESLQDGEGEDLRRFSMADMIEYLINTQPQFNESREAARSSTRVEVAMRGQPSEGPFDVERRDVKRLVASCAAPVSPNPMVPTGYPIMPVRRLEPFFEAFDKARPVKKIEAEEAKARETEAEEAGTGEPAAELTKRLPEGTDC